MKIYLVNENIDLGYHVKAAFFEKERADKLCEDENKTYMCQYPQQMRGPFEVEEIEVTK